MRDMRHAFGATVSDLLEHDPRVAVVLAEISTSYFERAMAAHPDRVVDVGIMEQTMVGVAAGFAMEGFHPIAHSLSPFMAERPYEQLKLDFGYQGLGGTFVGVGGSYDYASSGGTAPFAGRCRRDARHPRDGGADPGARRRGRPAAAVVLRERAADLRPREHDDQRRSARGGTGPDRGAPPRRRRDGGRVRTDARPDGRGVRGARRHDRLHDEPAPVRAPKGWSRSRARRR